jgi:toxin FitB
VEKATIYQLTQSIIQQTIQLRQIHKIKTPDAIIAATAVIHNLMLITRNTSDFKQIPGLVLVNPFEP